MEYPFLCNVQPAVDGRILLGLVPFALQCVGPVTLEEAQAHVALTQRIACCVRVTDKGAEYNAPRDWPRLWDQHNNPRYFIVIDDVEIVTYGEAGFTADARL